MKWQGKIGFVTFLLVIIGGMALIQNVAKAQGNIERQQAVEIVADYIQPSREPYNQVGEAQEVSDAFKVEIVPKAEDALVSEVFLDKPTSWMRPAAISGMMGPMCPSTWWDAGLAFETTGGQYSQISTVRMGPMMMGSGMHWIDEKNPSVAALLSLQPMPVALGNFYTDDWEKGILYTTLEVGMFIPGMILLSDRYFDHFHNGYTRNSWTDTEQTWFISLVTGYVVLKVISAFDAAYSAERYIRRVSLKVSPKMDGWALKRSVSF